MNGPVYSVAAQGWLQALQDAPWRFDFYQVMRRVEGLYPDSARIGESRRLGEDAVRLGQVASMSFAASNVERIGWAPSGHLRIGVRFLGLLGPQGPLPGHLTDLVRSREVLEGDPTLARFVDLFHHRQLALFYRAWRQAQPTASRDRPQADRFETYLGALIGEAGPAYRSREPIDDTAKRHFAGLLGGFSRHAAGLVAIIGAYFSDPVRLIPYAAGWIRLPRAQLSRIGLRDGNACLGQGALLGDRIFDAQHQYRLEIGPLRWNDFARLLPTEPDHAALRAWVRRHGGDAWGVTAQLALCADDVPQVRLGRAGRLGWSSWLGKRRGETAATDVCLRLSAPIG